MPITSFADPEVERFYRDGQSPRRAGWRVLANVALRKLDMITYAERLSDLASPPGNRLEALKGDYDGLHSIRINEQWRIVFRWTSNGAADVNIVDYH